MSRKLVYSIRPSRLNPKIYEATVEYMPGQRKTFVTTRKNFAWLIAEIEKALDNKVPTFTGGQNIQNEKDNERN